MATPENITDQRMLKLMSWAVENDLARTDTEYCEKINFPRTNLSNVRKGIQSFTRDHIYNACVFTGASADYIYGFTDSMMRKQPKNGLQMIKEAVMVLELEKKKK